MAEWNINGDTLSHHGILGMKWGIRRFQPYPSGYSGDGQYVGPKPGRKVTPRDERKLNKINRRIGSMAEEAVRSGDIKTVKKLKKVISKNDYDEINTAAVANGVKKAIDTGDVKALKKYKNALPRSTYITAMNKTRFISAVNSLSNKKMSKYAAKLSAEDMKEISSKMTTLSDMSRKISSVKHDSSRISDIASIAKDIGAITGVALAAKKIVSKVQDGKGGN